MFVLSNFTISSVLDSSVSFLTVCDRVTMSERVRSVIVTLPYIPNYVVERVILNFCLERANDGRPLNILLNRFYRDDGFGIPTEIYVQYMPNTRQ